MSKSVRVSRVEKSLREVLGKYLSSNSSLFEGALVTLVRVSCSPDLRNAAAFVSVYGGDEDLVFEILEEQRPYMQNIVGKEIPMKYCPKIKFMLDGSIDKLVHISDILNEDS